MYNQKFQKSERSRKRKAMIIAILFHVVVLGGLTFGTSFGVSIKDAVKSLFQENEPKKDEVTKAAIVKNSK